MPNFFSLRRFLALYSTYFSEYAKKISLQIFALLGCLQMMFLVFANFNNHVINEGMQIGIYYFGLYFGCFLFTASSLIPYANGAEASYQLLVPASSFEKILLHWLNTFIGFIVIYQICYHLCRSLTIALMAVWKPNLGQEFYDLIPNDMKDNQTKMLYTLSIFYIFIHSLSLLGSITFPKYTHLMTLFILIVGIGGIIGWQVYWITNSPILGHSNSIGLPFTSIEARMIEIPKKNIRIEFPLNPWLGIVTFACVQFLIYTATYFKLKEKQI
jgi:hypothetical protein